MVASIYRLCIASLLQSIYYQKKVTFADDDLLYFTDFELVSCYMLWQLSGACEPTDTILMFCVVVSLSCIFIIFLFFIRKSSM